MHQTNEKALQRQFKRSYCSTGIFVLGNLKLALRLFVQQMLLFEGKTNHNAVFTATLKYHQPCTTYNRIKTKSSEQASFQIFMVQRFAVSYS